VFAGMYEYFNPRGSFENIPIFELLLYPAIRRNSRANNQKGTVREEISAWHCSKLFSNFADAI
jgi:hypothetical protein